ncbi:MAG TPA: type II secretion system F family protein [Pirellulales bacterium]
MTGAVISAQSFPGLVLLGIAVLSSLHLFYRDRPPGEDLLHLAMTVIGRVMIVTAFVEASFLFFSFLAIPFGVVVFGILIYVSVRYALRRRVALLGVLAAASRRWQPLAPAAVAFSAEWGWPFRQRCRHLAELLDAGMPLGEALRAAGKQPRALVLVLALVLLLVFPPVGLILAFLYYINGGRLASRRALATVEVGLRTGNLSGALTEAARSPVAQPMFARVSGAIWYLGATVLAGLIVVPFVAIKIVPAYVKIFADFDAELPLATHLLIQFCDWFATYGWPPLVLGLFGASVYAVLWLFGAVIWLPPPLNGLSRRRDTITVLRALALASEVNRPLELALAALAEHHPSAALCGRLRLVLAGMAEGKPWAEGLARYGFLRGAELALLTSAERVGNLTWALRDVAEAIERRFVLRLQRFLEIMSPALVLIAGLAVMFVVVSLFLPLIRLITSLI